MARLAPTLQSVRWRRRTKTPLQRTPPNATAEADQAEHAPCTPATPLSHETCMEPRALGRSPDCGVNLPSPAGPACLTARRPRLRDCAKNARAFAFSFYRFCHNRKVEERIEVRPKAEPRAPKAIRFRSERFWSPKTALMDRLNLRIRADIRITFSSLQGKPQAGMGTLPPS
jgi:hypothetical protein